MTIDHDDVVRVTGEVWETALGLAAIPDDSPPTGGERVFGTVDIGGACRAEVVLGCDTRLARLAAAVLFAVPEAELSREQVHDAVGELTNMTGGQLKALLPDGCTLSVPKTTDAPTGPDTGIAFSCSSLAFSVAVTTSG